MGRGGGGCLGPSCVSLMASRSGKAFLIAAHVCLGWLLWLVIAVKDGNITELGTGPLHMHGPKLVGYRGQRHLCQLLMVLSQCPWAPGLGKAGTEEEWVPADSH
jgi:hypothetical protein